MPWFQVDDGLNSHPKARQAGLAAMGLWTIAGSYSMQHLTDGFAPDWLVKSWPGGIKLAAKLVEHKLWYAAEKDGVKGWQFHEWDLRQRSKEDVEAERKADRDRKSKERKARRAAAAGHPEHPASQETSGRTTDGTSDWTPDGSPETHALPCPTKPLQPTTQKSSTSGAAQRGSRLSEAWKPTTADLDWARQRTPHVDVTIETEKFINHWTAKTGKDATKLDWSKTWRNWLLNGFSRGGGASPNQPSPSTQRRSDIDAALANLTNGQPR